MLKLEITNYQQLFINCSAYCANENNFNFNLKKQSHTLSHKEVILKMNE